jgi:hypothetical protein
MNRSGLVLVAVFGWIIVTAFVAWTARGIMQKHRADTQLVNRDPEVNHWDQELKDGDITQDQYDFLTNGRTSSH